MELAIREAQLDDLPVLAEYEKEISLISFGDEAVTDMEHYHKRMRKAMERSTKGMFVLTVDQIVSGWLWMDAKTNFVTHDAYINFRSFYVAPDQRGSEWSERLLEYGMQYAQEVGATSIVGKTHVSNLPMRALYKKMGFEPTHLTMEWHAK